MLKQQCINRHVTEVRRMRNEKEKKEREKKEDIGGEGGRE